MNSQLTRRRKPMRIAGYDYAAPGLYFVTLCTQGRSLLFENQHFRTVVGEEWSAIPRHFANVSLDAFVVMPNHIHGIIVLNGFDEPDASANPTVGEGVAGPIDSDGQPHSTPSPTAAVFADPRRFQRGSIPSIIRLFKTLSGRRINRVRRTPGAKVWQRGYWEHIIRDDRSAERIRSYIVSNSLNWESDSENPSRSGQDALWDNLIREGLVYLTPDDARDHQERGNDLEAT